MALQGLNFEPHPYHAFSLHYPTVKKSLSKNGTLFHFLDENALVYGSCAIISLDNLDLQYFPQCQNSHITPLKI